MIFPFLYLASWILPSNHIPFIFARRLKSSLAITIPHNTRRQAELDMQRFHKESHNQEMTILSPRKSANQKIGALPINFDPRTSPRPEVASRALPGSYPPYYQQQNLQHNAVTYNVYYDRRGDNGANHPNRGRRNSSRMPYVNLGAMLNDEVYTPSSNVNNAPSPGTSPSQFGVDSEFGENTPRRSDSTSTPRKKVIVTEERGWMNFRFSRGDEKADSNSSKKNPFPKNDETSAPFVRRRRNSNASASDSIHEEQEHNRGSGSANQRCSDPHAHEPDYQAGGTFSADKKKGLLNFDFNLSKAGHHLPTFASFGCCERRKTTEIVDPDEKLFEQLCETPRNDKTITPRLSNSRNSGNTPRQLQYFDQANIREEEYADSQECDRYFDDGLDCNYDHRVNGSNARQLSHSWPRAADSNANCVGGIGMPSPRRSYRGESPRVRESLRHGTGGVNYNGANDSAPKSCRNDFGGRRRIVSGADCDSRSSPSPRNRSSFSPRDSNNPSTIRNTPTSATPRSLRRTRSYENCYECDTQVNGIVTPSAEPSRYFDDERDECDSSNCSNYVTRDVRGNCFSQDFSEDEAFYPKPGNPQTLFERLTSVPPVWPEEGSASLFGRPKSSNIDCARLPARDLHMPGFERKFGSNSDVYSKRSNRAASWSGSERRREFVETC